MEARNPELEVMRQQVKDDRFKVMPNQRQMQKYRQGTSLCLGLYFGLTCSRYPSSPILAIYLLICSLLRCLTWVWGFFKTSRNTTEGEKSTDNKGLMKTARALNLAVELAVSANAGARNASTDRPVLLHYDVYPRPIKVSLKKPAIAEVFVSY